MHAIVYLVLLKLHHYYHVIPLPPFFSMDSHFELESLSTVISEEGFIGKDGWKITDIIYIPPVSPSYLHISSIMFVAPLE